MAITTNGAAGISATAAATLSNKTLEAPIINNATFTGQQAGLQVAFNDSIVFEGTTADAYETTLSAGEPTADRTITLPNATDTLVGKATTDTLTNKSISLTTNTVTGTLAEFNTAVSDADLASLAGSETLSNKTLTSPVVSGLTLSDASIVFEGATADAFETTLTVTDPTADRTITIPDATTTLVGTDTTQTLTNKTLSSAVLTGSLTAGGGTGTSGQVLQSTGTGVQWGSAGVSGNDASLMLSVQVYA